MRKIIGLSFVVSSLMFAASSVELPEINVEEKINSKVVKNISSKEIKSADLAEALAKNVPSISLVRRSGIANDIILRGAKKDNINILLDEAKIYGACPNRMDPATSHVLANNIESVEVIEGPYDVENFGTLSGLVKVKTKEPSKGFGGEVNLNFGSFGYQKQSATIEAGTEDFKFMISASNEKSDQYKDGDGDDFYGQQVKNGTVATTANEYATDHKDTEAYEKKTIMAKAIANIDDSSEVKLSYTANRSDTVLYPNTPMDADYDDSDILTFGYTKRGLGEYSKELNMDFYNSTVDHPMSTTLRDNGAMKMTNNMKSEISGVKVKNSFEIKESLITVGLDGSDREWEGYYSNIVNPNIRDSISKTTTENRAAFLMIDKRFGKFNVEIGARYDDTSIENIVQKDNDYNSVSANIYTTYNQSDSLKYFAGFGKSSRVPDARELYFVNSAGANIGNPNLKEVQNYEVDFGIEKMFESGKIKSTVFYSKLKDYIYNPNGNSFENIDAKIFGLSLSGMYFINDELSLDYGLAYQRGKKDNTTYVDKDLAEIPPLKANITITYEQDSSQLSATLIAVDTWDEFDSDGGEQELSGYTVMNLKYNKDLNKNFDFTFGVDNVFDKTYATTNTYNDINYIGTGETSLINEPGRYIYANLRYKF